MSATYFKNDCPYCGTVKAGFECVYVRKHRGNNYDCHAIGVCGVCDEAIIIKYIDKTIASRGTLTDLTQSNLNFPNDKMDYQEVLPKFGQDIPERLPENVRSFYRQAVLNENNGHWDAAGAMFRKTLDVATKILDPSLANKSLFERINKLADVGKLTADISTWAHEVRIDGNNSVHDEEPETKEDVAAIHEFCRATLLYTFTLPTLVAERSSQNESLENAS